MASPGDPPWGWIRSGRWLLIGVAACLGLILLAMAPGQAGREPVPAPALSLDPNNAAPEVLTALPHIGPARASAIVQARADGPMTSLFELQQRVRGIGPATTLALAPYLRFPDEPPDTSTAPAADSR